MVNKSSSKESGYQSTLEPRPSIGKTSISIPSIFETESSKEEPNYEDEDSVANHISRLELASNYLTPVVDEIISKATSYTQKEFRVLLETRSPICAISVERFTRACKASDLLDEIQVNPFAISDYVVNTARLANQDRIYIDRDLMKQLVDLQNMIVETIGKLKENISDDAKPQTVREDLEENFVVIDKDGEESKRERTETVQDNSSGVRLLTVDVDKNMKNPKNLEKVSQMTAELPTLSDLCMPLEPISESGGDTEKTDPTNQVLTDTGFQSDDKSELMLKTEINDAENVVIKPENKYQRYECEGTLQPYICEDELNPFICSDEIAPTPENEDPATEFIDVQCRKDVANFQVELDRMKEMLSTLLREVELIRKDNSADKKEVEVPPPTDTTSDYQSRPQKYLEIEIIECLKELREIKNVLGGINNPDLVLDTTQRDRNKPCCQLKDFPHIHAKLDGIPVIIKLNKSSIDIVLSADKKIPKVGINPEVVELEEAERAGKTCLLEEEAEKLDNADEEEEAEKADNADEADVIEVFEEPEEAEEAEVAEEAKEAEAPEIAEEEVKEGGELKEEKVRRPGCKCLCRKNQEPVPDAKRRSSVFSRYHALPFPDKKPGQEAAEKKRHVVQTAFTNNCFERADLDDRESIVGLPYIVNKKSLPNINICPPMNIQIDQLKKGMRSKIIEHPKNRIKKQLTAVGVDNLIKASIPAECCRKAVINESEKDDQPFHASINSLPLTISDMQIITEVTGQETCMHLTLPQHQTKFEYYTNFQENLASNIDYYMPKSRVYEVRFFRIFKKDEHKPTKSGLALRLSEVLRRIIFNDKDGEEMKANEQVPPKLKRNKKCQTDQPGTIFKPSVNSLPQHGRILPTNKSNKYGYQSTNNNKSRSVQCKMSEEYEGTRNKLKLKTKTKHKTKQSLEKPMKYSQCYNSSQSIFACNTNLGTIYEREEKHPRKKLKNRPGKEQDFYEFMNCPAISESFQKFLTTEPAVKALEHGNVDTEQFWGMYFESKKSLNCDRATSDNINYQRGVPSQQRSRFGRYRKHSVSKIPRRIVKHSFSSTSSDSMIRRKKKLKTQERIEKKELVVTLKPKQAESPVEPKHKIPVTSSTISLLELASKYDSDAVDKAKIFVGKNMHDEPSTDCKDNSLESLQVLASKNGPGYITVLHPICGCPEVSIFIPCYCPLTSKNILSQQTIHKLVSRNDGRHIVLPRGCRVEKYMEENSNDPVKES